MTHTYMKGEAVTQKTKKLTLDISGMTCSS